MSIPRFAIQRPVMMTMISSIVILIGGISLTRLPVDLLPDISQPTVNVRVNYTGVGPLEMEELDHPAARAAAQRGVGPRADELDVANEGNANIQLNFTWGTDLNEAMDDIRTRIDRVRGRLPEDADPPVVQKFDSNAAPIMGLARREHRRRARSRVAARAGRERAVAAPRARAGRRRGDRRRRPAPPDSRRPVAREDHRARPVGRSRRQRPRTENQNIPIGEVYRGDRSLLLRSQGQFQNLDQIRNLVVLTKNGVPVYLKDIADVTDSTEDIRSVLRINGTARRPHAGDQAVGHQHRADRPGRARGDRAHQPRSAGRQAVAARRQRQVHRALDRRRAGARDDRLGAGHPDHLPVPAQLPLDADRLHRRFRFRSSAPSRCSTSAG